MFQHRSVWSSLPTANHVPPAGTAVQVVLPAWPVNVRSLTPPDTSQRTGGPCSYTTRHSAPEAEMEMDETGFPLPGRYSGPVSPPGRIMEVVPSLCPQAMTDPVEAVQLT